MIITNIEIKSFCVLKKTISLSLISSDGRQEVFEEIKKIKGYNYKFVLSATVKDEQGKKNIIHVDVKGKINSIGMPNNFTFTLHSKIEKYLIFSYLKLKNTGENIVMKFVSEKEKDIQTMMNKVARKLNITPEEALIKATTFKKRAGRGLVQGKSNIYSLTEQRKSIALKRLKEMAGSGTLAKTI